MVGMDDIFDHGEGSFSGRFKIFFVLVNYFSRFTKVYFFGCRVHLQEWHLYSPYQKTVINIGFSVWFVAKV